MHTDHRFLQLRLDGELGRAESAAVESQLAEQPALRAEAGRLEALDGLLRRRGAALAPSQPAEAVARVMERLPQRLPKREVQISVAHVVVGVVLSAFVVMAFAVADSLASVMHDVVPVWALAALSAAIGLALLVAARPLLHLEAGILARLLSRRLAVGDGEVLVCRLLGVALIVGGAHLAHLWG
jgi:anti-sigma factor RsiW